jgi:L-ascorbate metabolism protein UlaG (beta-lactamase superfamily)
MSKLFKYFKVLILSLVSLTVLLCIVGYIFMNTSPEFGGEHTAQKKEQYLKSGHYKDGKFINQITTNMDMDFSKLISILGDFIKGVPNGRPDFKLPVEKIDSLDIVNKPLNTRLTWFGHSAFLLEIKGKNILIDPMLGDTPAPHPWLGTKRFSDELPIAIEKLPFIDAIIISHDHYDHLDYGSIMKLKEKAQNFYVPLGVGVHLESWGIPKERIFEMNWWDEIDFDDLKIVFAPARHFSGRGFSDRFSTLWGSWIITSENENIYFSGDSGYGSHFKEIGERYGPFDFAMIECGQYDLRWSEIHMMPEESAQAAVDLKTKIMMPIHWGAFKLALHSWTDPIKRVSRQAAELNMPLTAPKIGESIFIDSNKFPNDDWWND